MSVPVFLKGIAVVSVGGAFLYTLHLRKEDTIMLKRIDATVTATEKKCIAIEKKWNAKHTIAKKVKPKE